MLFQNDLPSFVVYQMNGKTAFQNYKDFKDKQFNDFMNYVLEKNEFRKELYQQVNSCFWNILQEMESEKKIDVNIYI